MLHRTTERLIVAPAVEPISLVEAQQACRIDGDFDADFVTDCIGTARRTLEKWCWSAFITQTWQYWWNRFWPQMQLPRPPVRVGWNQGNIASTSWAAGTATVVLSTADQNQFLATLYVGQAVTIAGVSVAGYNGPVTITALTATGFQYAVAATLTAATGGTAATVGNGGVQWIKYLQPSAGVVSPSSYLTVNQSVWETSAENELPFIRQAWLQTWPVTRGYQDDVWAQVVCGYGNNPSDVPDPLRHAMKLLVAFCYYNRGEAPATIPPAIGILIEPYRYREM